MKSFFTSLLIASVTSMLYYIGVHQNIEWVGYIFWILFYGVFVVGVLLCLSLAFFSYLSSNLKSLGEDISTTWLNLKGSFLSDLISKPFGYLVLYTLYVDGHTTELIFLMVSSVLIQSLDRVVKRNLAKHYKLKEHITTQLKD